MIRRAGWLLAGLLAMAAPAGAQTLRGTGTPANLPKLTVTSPDFAPGSPMPRAVAYPPCGGADAAPEIRWSGAPAGTKSFVLTLFDPDAPTGVGFWHWVLMDIPPGAHAAGGAAGIPTGAIGGMTDHGKPGYQGPCPPAGDHPHHYRFTVRALDIPAVPNASADTTGAAATFEMRGHILAEGTLVGTYAR
ncbi:MAG: hypothetical protein B7Z80_16710 [Rhodospirillales bacterium 20-64-7]|nr:MAG: hypothetical protein B7Z80_16710 [Rhodospirillales bacterium 20-64-7]